MTGDARVGTVEFGAREESTAGVPIDGEALTVGYGDGPVIEGETLTVPAGEVTSLVGPNGSGKSTLLKALADQLAPEAGDVYLDGRVVGEYGAKEFARRLGLLSQNHTSPESLTVEELVYHGRYPHRGFLDPVDESDAAAVERAIELAGIDRLRDRAVGELSGGQTQLARVAMVLAQETDVLLLDEPTTFLDMHHQLAVLDVVERLNRETDRTVLLVLHDVNQAAAYADTVVALADGSVQAVGDPEAVVTEELLREIFAVEATVEPGERGPRVIPHRPLDG